MSREGRHQEEEAGAETENLHRSPTHLSPVSVAVTVLSQRSFPPSPAGLLLRGFEEKLEEAPGLLVQHLIGRQCERLSEGAGREMRVGESGQHEGWAGPDMMGCCPLCRLVLAADGSLCWEAACPVPASRCPAVPREAAVACVTAGQLGWYSSRDGGVGAVRGQPQHGDVAESLLAGSIHRQTYCGSQTNYMSHVDISCSCKFV